MSLLHALATRVVTVRGDLPLDEVGVAASRLRSATTLLAATFVESSSASPAPLLASAASHLDAAAGALGRAGDELSRYLASVGVAPVSASVVSGGGCAWADRVDVLCGLVGAARPGVDPRLSVGAVLVAAVRAAADGDRVALRRALVTAPPSVGWALAARTAGLVGVVAPSSARLGFLARFPGLLPGLPAPAADALACRALRLPGADVSAHPADPAAVGVVLVSVVLSLTGAPVESLATEGA